jgi:hypothetical protein
MDDDDTRSIREIFEDLPVIPEPGPDDPAPGLDHPWGRRPPGYWAGPDAEELNAAMERRIDEKIRLGRYPTL